MSDKVCPDFLLGCVGYAKADGDLTVTLPRREIENVAMHIKTLRKEHRELRRALARLAAAEALCRDTQDFDGYYSRSAELSRDRLRLAGDKARVLLNYVATRRQLEGLG